MKAIYFDLDGTLLTLSRPYDEILSDTFKTVEGESREEWVERYHTSFFELFGNCESNPYRRAFATVSDNPDALVNALRKRETEACEPPDDARATLDGLAEKHRLGVLTNGVPEWQMHKLRVHDLDSYFETVVTSYEAGANKPEREPFLLAEEQLPADSYAMVGDSDDDIDGAESVGWTSYRYRGEGFGSLPGVLDWE